MHEAIVGADRRRLNRALEGGQAGEDDDDGEGDSGADGGMSAPPALVCFHSAAAMRRYVEPHGFDLSVSDFTEQTNCLNASVSERVSPYLRYSYSTAFYEMDSPAAQRLSERVEADTGLQRANGGKFQITSYPLGVSYDLHEDCSVGSPELRDRVGTLLIYLSDVPDGGGGETTFPQLKEGGLGIQPTEGSALAFNSMDDRGRCLRESEHEASRVSEGHKYILQRWYYFENFPGMARPVPATPVPVRDPHTPMVLCDGSSCRWYSEWPNTLLPRQA